MKIRITFLDGEILTGETLSFPTKGDIIFWMQVNGKRTGIGTNGIKKIEVEEERESSMERDFEPKARS